MAGSGRGSLCMKWKRDCETTYVEKVANLLTQRYAHDYDIKPIVDLQNDDSKKILLILLQK